eukprot:365089-Chlamydomonas_euryale.AAC.13
MNGTARRAGVGGPWPRALYILQRVDAGVVSLARCPANSRWRGSCALLPPAVTCTTGATGVERGRHIVHTSGFLLLRRWSCLLTRQRLCEERAAWRSERLCVRWLDALVVEARGREGLGRSNAHRM